MLKHFTDDDERANRALQIWLILIGAAYNRQTITYKVLANMIGYPGGNVLGQILSHIEYYCQDHKLPPLTVIVVYEKTGLPGSWLNEKDPNTSREKVFAHNWYDDWPPTPEVLASANAAHQ